MTHPLLGDLKLPAKNMGTFRRHAANPVITADDVPVRARSVFNPGAVKFGGEYLVLADVCLPHNPIILWLFRSQDGVNFTPDPAPIAWPDQDPTHTEHCVYDPRITYLADEDRYVLCYATQGHNGVRVGMIETTDFKTYKRLPTASELENRNAVLFPEKINGQYVRLDRPFQGDDHHCVWISRSDNMVYWGKTQMLLPHRPGFWDDDKVGGGAVPIKTQQGWLCIYHGTTRNCNGVIYQLGVCLLDLHDPSKVIARGTYPVFSPKESYEATGYVPNVVFTANAILEEDGMVRMYYGSADTCIGLATMPLDELLAACFC
jgi:beta-1,4-mannooligosaccharide/beta-1,4-mannosyl-N-acetylglucosamine phosphorylase